MIHNRLEARGDWGEMRASGPVAMATGRFAMPDGIALFYRSWTLPGAPVLLILHGLGAHSGWFIDMGNALAERGLTVYAVDHRGFGRSDGRRGHIVNYRVFLQDTSTVLDRLREQHLNAPIFLFGHSMGAILAIYTAARRPGLAGVMLLNPWIKDTTKVSPGMLLGVVVGGILRLPIYYQLAGGSKAMTVNPEAAEMLANDPYWVRAETASFFWQITLMRAGVLHQAGAVHIPALVAQAGRDRSVRPAASYAVYERLGSADKTWKMYPSYAHDSEFEPDRRALDDDIAIWVHSKSESYHRV
jgi:alpha-beta hydrolase superfamily lysophospholipase